MLSHHLKVVADGEPARSRQTGGTPSGSAESGKAGAENQGQTVQVINCGSFSPSEGTLIHELAHVWQLQHHSSKFRFMVNPVDSQAGAVDDPFVILNKDFPTFFPFDAYACHPSLPFSSLAAEQMAKAVENGEAAVVGHVKAIARNAVDADCVTALSKAGFADRRLSGVK